jgi:uncharacterized membrane protein YfcA
MQAAPPPQFAATILPLVIVAVVFALRFRNLNRPRKLRLGMLVAIPALIGALVIAALAAQPPSALGWGLFAGGLIVGAFAGWWRGKLMHIERDPATGALMLRQSPMALLFLMGLFVIRRLAVAGAGGLGGGGHQHTLLVTEALMGFGLAMVAANRLELWLRSKRH